jgi:hypothetical protein
MKPAKDLNPHEDCLEKIWRKASESLEFARTPRIHDLRHCWKTNSMRSGLHPLIADAVVGHGEEEGREKRFSYDQ